MKYFKKGDFIKAVGISLAFGATVALAAWSGPTAAPPNNNTPPPLNVGSVGQSKGGNLAINLDGTLANGLLVPFGKVGIGTSNPGSILTIGNGTQWYPQITMIAGSNENGYSPADIEFKVGNRWMFAVGVDNKASQGSYGRFYVWDDASNSFGTHCTICALQGSGYVGINQTNPTFSLDVSGGIRVYQGGSALPSSSGGFMTWNKSGGQGETNFIVNPGAGSGTNSFTFDKTTDGSTLTRLMTISGTGNVTTNSFTATPGAAPGSPTKGQIYFNGTDNHFYGWNGTTWKQLDN